MRKSDGQAWSSSSPVTRSGRSEVSIALNVLLITAEERGKRGIRGTSELPLRGQFLLLGPYNQFFSSWEGVQKQLLMSIIHAYLTIYKHWHIILEINRMASLGLYLGEVHG